MTFGNYVLFNLLVAILVEGFSNQVRNKFMNLTDRNECLERIVQDNDEEAPTKVKFESPT